MSRIKSDMSCIAFNYIRDKIFQYELKPNDTVSELTISQELGMSRTPVKEALQKLIALGLVKKERTRYSVVPINEKDIIELLDMREALETISVKEILERGGLNSSEIANIKKISKKLSSSLENNNFIENFNTDRDFHREIVKYSRNSRALQIFDQVELQSERFRWICLLNTPRYQITQKEHLAIINNLINKKELETIDAIHIHIVNSKKNYLSIIKANKNWEEMLAIIKKSMIAKFSGQDAKQLQENVL